MQSRSTRSRQAIVDAATSLIRARGVQGTTMSDLTKAAGVSVGAIYHHFDSKQDVVVAVAHQAVGVPMAALEAYAHQPSSPAVLFTFAVTALRANPDLSDLLVQLGAGSTTDDALGRQLRAEFGALRDLLDTTMHAWAKLHQVPLDRIDGMSQLLVGLVLGYASQRNLVHSFDPQAYLDQGVALLAVPGVER